MDPHVKTIPIWEKSSLTLVKTAVKWYDDDCSVRKQALGHGCILRRRADTGAFASGHSAAATDSALISHFPLNHNDIVFRHPLEQRVG